MRSQQPCGATANRNSLAGSQLRANQLVFRLDNVQFLDWDAHGPTGVQANPGRLPCCITALDLRLEGTVLAVDFGALRGKIGEHTSELQSHVNLVCRLLLE